MANFPLCKVQVYRTQCRPSVLLLFVFKETLEEHCIERAFLLFWETNAVHCKTCTWAKYHYLMQQYVDVMHKICYQDIYLQSVCLYRYLMKLIIVKIIIVKNIIGKIIVKIIITKTIIVKIIIGEVREEYLYYWVCDT